MKRKIIRMIAFAMVLVIAGTCTSLAGNDYKYREVNRFRTLKEGKHTRTFYKSFDYPTRNKKTKTITYNWYIYKIKLPEDGIVTFSLSGIDKKAARKAAFYVDLYSSKKRMLKDPNDKLQTRNVGEPMVLKKGTYYLRYWFSTQLYDEDKLNRTKIKYTFRKYKNRNNTSFENAYPLKADKTAWIAQTTKRHYIRYYKIDLKESQKLRVESTPLMDIMGRYPDFTVYDESQKVFEIRKVKTLTSKAGGTLERYETKKKLPSGTYYIEVDGWFPIEGMRGTAFGDVMHFKWW
jgi:hypothetical protein